MIKKLDEILSSERDEERQRRIEAVKYANASVELEGFKLSSEHLERQKQFIDGKINTKDLVAHDIGER